MPPPRYQRESLLGLVDDFKVFHDTRSIAYAAFDRKGHRETWPVSTLGRVLLERYYRERKEAPGEQAVQEALRTLDARARLDGPERPVFRRVGENDRAIYLDLCDDEWRSVRIGPKGWKVDAFERVYFVRADGMRPLPAPQSGGSLDELRDFLPAGLDDDAWRLIVAFLAMALQPSGPYPMLVLQGPAGSGKTTCAKMVRALVDPHRADLTSLPRDERDLMISASNSWFQAFDNVSDLKPWLSDALCRLATGAAYRTRQLYTDSGESIFNEQRPILLNGIDRFIWREDLLSRALVIGLSEVPLGLRRSEDELWPAFEAARGRILGALLDAIVRAMRERPKVKVNEGPRLMDFALWGVAIEGALAWPEGSFMQAYDRAQDAGAQDIVDGSPFASAIIALVQSRGAEWTGTPGDLLAKIREGVPTWATLPRSPRGVTSALERYSNVLKRAGVVVEHPPRGQRRTLILRWLPDPVGEATAREKNR